MIEILSTQHSGAPATASDHNELLLKLDGLLERYLHLLDDYQTAREQLSRQLCSGYFSLAQANFNSSSRTRYGQDYYDERMQALRRVRAVERGSSNAVFTVSKLPPRNAPQTSSATAESRQDSESSEASTVHSSIPVEQASNNVKEETKLIDPLRWFGILVPPALRSAQESFVQAVEGPIPGLINAMKEMRSLESEIGRLRKDIKRRAAQ